MPPQDGDLALVVRFGEQVHRLSNPQEVARAAARLLGEHLGVARAAFGQVAADDTFLVVAADWVAGGAALPSVAGWHRIGDFGAPALRELRAGRVFAIEDNRGVPRLAGGANAVLAGIRAALLVPLLEAGRLAGMLLLHDVVPRRWRPEEVTLARVMAQLAREAVRRARAEAAGRAAQARFRQFADAVPAMLWATDAQGGVTYFNERWFRYTGQTPEQAMPQGWTDTLLPMDREPTFAAWQAALRAGTGHEVEHRLRARDGSHRWFLTRSEPLRDEAGRITGWIGIASDSHAHREVEAALRSSQELFRQFAEHSTDVLWILDAATLRAEYLSPAFEKVWGLPRGALAGSPERNSRDIWLETVHPEDRGPAAEAMARVREGEVSVTEYRITRADGAVRRIRDTFFPIRDAASRVSRVAGIAKDVTQHEGSDVYIVDGEPAWHSRLSRLLEDAGYRATVFGTIGGFLEAAPALVPGCVLLNLAQPEAPALAVPRELKARRLALPVIVTSQCHDVGMAVRAMKAGAADFLPAPCGDAALLAAVSDTMAEIRGSERRDRAAELARARIASLLPREREVLDLLLAGGTNKTIGRDLGISPRTVEFHRARVMERLGARTLPEAVLAAAAAGLRPPSPEAQETDPA
ncbi:PAS domain-containing protein [Dankookia rubra]|uniref:PAS domain-containing protein n=1 Tax=Dankookia rubra TaxID=1442381 RepID=UPI001408ECAA|nr:PAS domain-containing protein [Dankookia rubra]